MPLVTTDDGAVLSWRRTGDGRPSLVFMHGWAGSGRYFDLTLDQLSPDPLSAVTYDLRGHGASTSTPEDHSIERIAADALAVADAADLADFVLVGFSMSAKFAQYVALSAPERVAGLILVAGCPAGPLDLPAELIADWLDREGDAARMADLPGPFMTRPVERKRLEEFGADAARAGGPALRGTLDAVLSSSFADRVGSLRVPTLVVGGRGDPMFGPDALRGGVVGPLARARLALLDCGHEIPLEAPAELAAVIEAFVAGLSPVRATGYPAA